MDSTERSRSDVDETSLELGWEKGYYIHYFKYYNAVDYINFEQSVSLYPLENITKVFGRESDSYFKSLLNFSEYSTQNNLTSSDIGYLFVAELPDPQIGEESIAYRVEMRDDEELKTFYFIEFRKYNVYELLSMSGRSLEYGFLKLLADKASKKIIAIGSMPDTTYRNAGYEFSVEYPENYAYSEAFHAITMEPVVVFFGQRHQNTRTHIIIAVLNTPNMTLAEYIERDKKINIFLVGQNAYSLLEEGNTTVSDSDAYYTVFAFRLAGISLKEKQMTIKRRDNFYVITLVAHQDVFDSVVPEYDKTIQTFQFIK